MRGSGNSSGYSLTFAFVLKVPSIAEAEALADEIRRRTGFYVVYEKASPGRLRIVAEV
jgi:hypothetical protein